METKTSSHYSAVVHETGASEPSDQLYEDMPDDQDVTISARQVQEIYEDVHDDNIGESTYDTAPVTQTRASQPLYGDDPESTYATAPVTQSPYGDDPFTQAQYSGESAQDTYDLPNATRPEYGEMYQSPYQNDSTQITYDVVNASDSSYGEVQQAPAALQSSDPVYGDDEKANKFFIISCNN